MIKKKCRKKNKKIRKTVEFSSQLFKIIESTLVLDIGTYPFILFMYLFISSCKTIL